MNRITKAVIPIAGKATRLYPITTVLCKSMIPIIDKPVLAYLLDELVQADLQEVLIIVNPIERNVQEYFRTDYKGLKIQYKIQPEPKGLGDAVALAEEFVGNDNFILMLGDDLYEEGYNASKELINKQPNYETALVALVKVDRSDVEKYGICTLDSNNYVQTIIEKPKLTQTSSNLAISGRYLLTSSIFSKLCQVINNETELLLTDALALYLEENKLLGCELSGPHYDIGNRSGLVKTILAYSLKRPDLNVEINEYLKTLKLK